jgi:hypothetical protein
MAEHTEYVAPVRIRGVEFFVVRRLEDHGHGIVYLWVETRRQRDYRRKMDDARERAIQSVIGEGAS